MSQRLPFTRAGETALVRRGNFAGQTVTLVDWADAHLGHSVAEAIQQNDPVAIGFRNRQQANPWLFYTVNRSKFDGKGNEIKSLRDRVTGEARAPRFDGYDIIFARFDDGAEVLLHAAELEDDD